MGYHEILQQAYLADYNSDVASDGGGVNEVDQEPPRVLPYTLPDPKDDKDPNTIELYRLLQEASSYRGSFAHSSIHSATPNPGLKIEGFGNSVLRLPVSREDAAALLALGGPSPFGKGEQTIVDPKVRSSRQLDPSKVHIDNPAFSEWLQGPVLKEIGTVLGIDEDMRPSLNLYKLLIYQKGDHFKPHRDSPKEDGMIGTVVVILPSAFEGGIVKLSHGGETMEFDFASLCKYNIGTAAWYSDVEHAVDEVTDGYRIALVYNLMVEGGGLCAEKTAVSPQLLDILKAVRSSQTPIAYSLYNRYTLNQRKLGFKGSDRYVISNLIAAMKKVGGLALYCGDVEIECQHEEEDDYDDMSDDDDDEEEEEEDEDEEEEDEDEDDEDDEDENMDEDGGELMNARKRAINEAHRLKELTKSSKVADLSKTRNGDISIKFSNLEHLSGSFRHFEESINWYKRLLSLGPKLSEMEPTRTEEEYTGNEGLEYHKWYQTTCIILWPTKEAESLRERLQDPSLTWSALKRLINEPNSSIPSLQETPELKQAKLLGLIDHCIVKDLSDDQVSEAGKEVNKRLQDISSRFMKRIEKISLLRFASSIGNITNKPKSLMDEGSREAPTWSTRLQRLLRVKRLFPKDIKLSFDHAVKEILTHKNAKMTSEALRDLLETYKEEDLEILKTLLYDLFLVHPDPDILMDLHLAASQDPRLKAHLDCIPAQSFHECIINGIGANISSIAKPPFNGSETFSLRLEGYQIKNEYTESEKQIIFLASIFKFTNYLEHISQEPEPHRTNLVTKFADVFRCPPNLFDEPRENQYIVRAFFLPLVSAIIARFAKLPEVSCLHCVKTLREHLLDTIFACIPSAKPQRPNYYLPAWVSPDCENGAGCEICGPINQFLQSNTEYSFEITQQPGQDEHYSRLEEELQVTRVFMMGPNRPAKYAYADMLSVDVRTPYDYMYSATGSRNKTFVVIKKAFGPYMIEKMQHRQDINIRLSAFLQIAEPVDKSGKIEREVRDGSFTPIPSDTRPPVIIFATKLHYGDYQIVHDSDRDEDHDDGQISEASDSDSSEDIFDVI